MHRMGLLYLEREIIMNKKGFTLMEVLTVVLIIGILSSVALPQYRKVVEKSKFTKAQVMAKAMYDSCQRLVAEWGVDNYSSLPSNVRSLGLGRLDIGSPSLLPTGFTCNASNGQCRGSVITGAGFEYTLNNDCSVNIVKKEGTYLANFTYSGTEFTCTETTAAGESCAIYGLD